MNGNVEKFKKVKGEKYVALYHGTLYKCKMNENYERKSVKLQTWTQYLEERKNPLISNSMKYLIINFQ